MFFAAIRAPHPLQLISCREARLIVTSVRFLTNSSGIGMVSTNSVSEMVRLRVEALDGDLPGPGELEDLVRLQLPEESAAEREVHRLRGDPRILPQHAPHVG